MIKANSHEDWSKDANGSSLIDNISLGYHQLVEAFGEPTMATDGYKVDAEWHVTFQINDEHAAFVTIYNYKDGKNYLGANGLNVEDITDWHVGGKSRDDLRVLEDYFEQESVDGVPTRLAY